jgi:hypothetical protein
MHEPILGVEIVTIRTGTLLRIGMIVESRFDGVPVERYVTTAARYTDRSPSASHA